jgi:hypothetical protein
VIHEGEQVWGDVKPEIPAAEALIEGMDPSGKPLIDEATTVVTKVVGGVHEVVAAVKTI